MLVVAPTGLLRNWQDEHDKHLSGHGLGRAVEAHGATLRRIRKRASGGTWRRAGLRSTTLASGDPEGCRLGAYHLRDSSGLSAQLWQGPMASRNFRRSAEDQESEHPSHGGGVGHGHWLRSSNDGNSCRESPADIWSLLDRAEPGRFGTLKDFSALYERETVWRHHYLKLHRALTQPSEESGPALMLRRLKEERIPRLPKKLVHRRVVEMPSRQADQYADIVLDPSSVVACSNRSIPSQHLAASACSRRRRHRRLHRGIRSAIRDVQILDSIAEQGERRSSS